MKVLSKGLWRYNFTCEECMAVLMAEQNDFRSTQIRGTQEIVIVCECPQCGTVHKPGEGDLPADVRNAIMNSKGKRA